MDRWIPTVGAVIAVVLAILSPITFVYLNARFEGSDPTRALRDPYELTAPFSNTKGLPTKQPVLHRGLVVGRVKKVSWDSARRQVSPSGALTRDKEHTKRGVRNPANSVSRKTKSRP